MSQPLAAALGKLQESAGTLPVSAFTASQRRALDELARRTGAVRVKTEGAGSVYQVLNAQLLETHLQTLRPKSPAEIDFNLPRRAANIAHGRDSKSRSHSHDLHYLLVKGIGDGVYWEKGEGGRIFDLSTSTVIAGAGVLALSENDGWQSTQALWLVENQLLFDRVDWMPEDVHGTLAYYAGQLPARLLNWLAARQRVPEVIFFPDYDGVGLLNYARLREACMAPCSFWFIPGWRGLLTKYGNNALWRNTQIEFQTAISRLESIGMEDELKFLCQALSQHGLALEHEAVWLTGTV